MSKILLSELERLLEQLSTYVDELIEQVQSNPIDSESEVQLREVSKAIERLESLGISIPAALLDEKSRLLSIVGSNKSNHDQAVSIYNRLNTLVLKLREATTIRIRGNETNRRPRSNRQPSLDGFESDIRVIVNSDEVVDISFCKIYRIFVIDEWYQTRNWRDAKAAVYNRLIQDNPNIELSGVFKFSKDKKSFRSPITLLGNYYTEGNLSANEIVKHCCESMRIAGYGNSTQLRFEIVKS